jgi:hypothetical protein
VFSGCIPHDRKTGSKEVQLCFGWTTLPFPLTKERGHNFTLVVLPELRGVKPQQQSVGPKCEARLLHGLSPFGEQAARAGISQKAFEPARLKFGHATAEPGETVVSPAFVIFRWTFGEFFDETGYEQAMDGTVESAWCDGAYVTGALLDVAKDGVSVAVAVG